MTGHDKAHVEISYVGEVIQRRDIATTHKETDNIIVQQDIKSLSRSTNM